MANWKERGEVPDSDDDDDLDLESQPLSNINNEELATELPVDEYQAPEEPHLKGTGQEEDGDPTIGPPYDYFQSTSEVAAGQDGWDILAPEVEPSSSTIRTPEDARQPSPDSPRVFTLPTDFLDDNERILSDVHEPKEPGCVPVPVIEDEISQSYVRITSQASSPLSSPPRSQISSTRDKGRPSQDQRLDQDIQQQILGEQSVSTESSTLYEPFLFDYNQSTPFFKEIKLTAILNRCQFHQGLQPIDALFGSETPFSSTPMLSKKTNT